MAPVGGPMLFSNIMHTQIVSTHGEIILTSDKMNMHSNSHDISTRSYVEWRPHVSMDIAQQVTQGSPMSWKFHKTGDNILKELKVAHENLLGSGDEMPRIGRDGGIILQYFGFFGFGCTSRAHTQYR